MIKDAQNSVIDLIQQLANKTIELNKQLKKDVDYFKANDLIAIEKSNENKQSINKDILNALNAIESHPAIKELSGNYIEKINAYVETQNQQNAAKLQRLTQKVSELWNDGYKLAITNGAIVDANLNFTKDILSALMGPSKTEIETYDKSASLR